MAVYLIHFDQPLYHAQHYIGYTSGKVCDRLERHRQGRGARLLKAVQEKGINWHCVRVWKKGDRKLERQLKNQKNAKRFCPVCQHIKTGKIFYQNSIIRKWECRHCGGPLEIMDDHLIIENDGRQLECYKCFCPKCGDLSLYLKNYIMPNADEIITNDKIGDM